MEFSASAIDLSRRSFLNRVDFSINLIYNINNLEI